jgi:hypothetical protein
VGLLYLRHPHVVVGLKTSMLPMVLCPFCQAIPIPSSSLIPIFCCHRCPCLHQSLKLSLDRRHPCTHHDGTRWSLFKFFTTGRSISKPPWPTFPPTSARPLHLSKVQASRGNYLSLLGICTEQVDPQDDASWERNMDDLPCGLGSGKTSMSLNGRPC